MEIEKLEGGNCGSDIPDMKGEREQVARCEDMERKVFICYSPTDGETANDLKKAFHQEGVEICTSSVIQWDVPDYWEKVAQTIEKCEFFAMVSSNSSMHRKLVLRELDIADLLDKARIDFRIDDSAGTNRLEEFFDSCQCVKLNDYPTREAAIEAFISAYTQETIQLKNEQSRPSREQQKTRKARAEAAEKARKEREEAEEQARKIAEAEQARKEREEAKRQAAEAAERLRQAKKEEERKAAERVKKEAADNISFKQNFEYSIDASGITITKYKGVDNKVSIPSLFEGKPITSIGYNVFDNCYGLAEVHITDIAAWCGISFGNYSSNPLYYAKTLYLNGVLVTDLVIPAGVTSIGRYAFYKCTELTSVTMGNGVTSIGSSAFKGCSGLTAITIPGSVTSIGERAFYDCSKLTAITIPGSVKGIGSSAFENCSGLTAITIPSGVTSIGSSAFKGCSRLTSITIPASVTSIGDYAFDNCYGLAEVHITDIAAWCGISFGDYWSNPLYYAKTLYLNGVLVTDLVIPAGVTSIGRYAFEDCSGLTSVTIPAGVTSIGANAFYGCRWLTSVTIPAGVTSIGVNAFRCCSGLTSVTIPASVTSIAFGAFNGCFDLTVYCEAESKPRHWDRQWNIREFGIIFSKKVPVRWGRRK